MKLTDLLRLALHSLKRNKLRTFLTMLGIIIGVGSVIAMLGIGEGSKENIQSQIAGLGTNVVIVFPSSSSSGGVRSDAGSAQSLTQADADMIKERCPSVKYVSPIASTRNLKLSDGNYFTPSDQRSAAKVCVLGQTVVDNLFDPNDEVIGKFIRINNIPFKVIGVLQRKGQNTFGQDQDDIVVTPFSTVQKRIISSKSVQQILISANTEALIPQASDEVTNLLRARHKIRPEDENDFSIRTQTEIASLVGSTSAILTILLASIASISLLVGGIGIMNIMLVSVTERTKEIGLRMAVGAKGSDVLMQFLIEAILMSVLGGLIGIGLGLLTAFILSSTLNWPVSVQIPSIVISFILSAGIGVFFGWYPARKAARLNPIDALRYE
jgi:putative ABC transport system permease protein